MRNYAFAVFILIFGTAYVLMHYYAAWFMQRNFPVLKHLRYSFLLMAFFSAAVLFLRRSMGGDIIYYLSLAGYVWMGCMLIFTFFFLLCDLLTLSGWRFGIKFFPIFFLLAAAITSSKAVYNGVRVPQLRKVEVFSAKIKKELKIILLADIHIDYRFKKKNFLKIMEKAGAENPDLILFAGDILDPGFEMSEKEYAYLKSFKTPLAGCMGNHEYYYGVEKSREVYGKMGIRLLFNSALELGGINLIGFGDLRTENISREEFLGMVERNYSPELPNVILSHQPFYFRELSEKGEFLMLSAHVHKGQIFPFHLLVRLAYKYFYGLYRENDSYLYVTSGAGTWGPPMRFLAGAEIPVITVKPGRP
ncbi:MAG: hypothetical protein COT17_01270 [Elusimicrobia bacterium CG08_land_8_20_14_0_20_51_18]|nr:MAG: hypothetical protein COT17_01270 [Elusimicrobia bacterium CG08_land_8_20_14_0_20_51_18]